MRYTLAFFAVTVLLLSASLTVATVPSLINYQGVLRDAGGHPIKMPTSIQFRIWSADVGGVELWTESQLVTPDAQGGFDVLLGVVAAIPESVFVGDAYLGMTIAPDAEMTPRARIVSVGYAYRVGTVDGASGGAISGNLNLENSTGSGGLILKEGKRFLHNYGVGNTFVGQDAGNLTMTGSANTASGAYTLLKNTTGTNNTASGYGALNGNTTGYHNTASGFVALNVNTIGLYNTANGASALELNTSGSANTASGAGALTSNTEGHHNTASGYGALSGNTTGSNNTAIGYNADVLSNDLTNATAIGYNAKVTASNSMVFGDGSVVKWVFGDATPAAGSCLQVGTNATNGNGAYLTTGGAWTNGSDRNTKEGITLVDGSELLGKVGQLRLYRWNYKGEDPSHQHVGPMAQDFHAIFDLGDDDKHISTIDPAGVALAAIQALYEKQNSENQELRRQIEELRALIRTQPNGVK